MSTLSVIEANIHLEGLLRGEDGEQEERLRGHEHLRERDTENALLTCLFFVLRYNSHITLC